MATYGVYTEDLKGCYISGLDIIDAKRHLSGRGDRVHIGKRFPECLPDGYKVGK